MIQPHKWTGIIGGNHQPLCKMAVSPVFAGVGYNGAPDGVKPTLNNVDIDNGYFDFTGNTGDKYINAGDYTFAADESFMLTIVFTPTSNDIIGRRIIISDNYNTTNSAWLSLDLYGGLRTIIRDNTLANTQWGKTLQVFNGTVPANIKTICSVVIDKKNSTLRGAYSIGNSGFYTSYSSPLSPFLGEYNLSNIKLGYGNNYEGKIHNFYLNQIKEFDIDRINAFHKLLGAK